MLDLVIRGGQVVTPHGTGPWEVAIQGEKIVALAVPGTLTTNVARVIDAGGKIVVPGGIDPHMHCKWPLPPLEGGAPQLSAFPDQVSRAALHGGTTMMVDFAVWNPGQTIQQALEAREPDWRGQCHCDYAYHLMLQGHPIPSELLPQVAEAIQAGHASVKIFTTDVTPSRRGRKILHGDIWEILQVVARSGGVSAIHAEDDEIVMHQYDKFLREGRVSYENIPEVHNTLSEDLSFRRVIRLAELVEGAALYMVHVSAASGVQAIAESRARGFPIYGETLHHYASYTSDAYRRPNGQIYHTYPSLKGEEDCRALWKGMATVNGPISTVATDGICTPLQVKVQGKQIDDITGGNAGAEPRMGVMYTETVVRRGFSLEHFVNVTSANAAKILGMYPRKGAIAVGSDADLALIDPSIEKELSKEDLHETDYSPWEGWKIAGWPVMTILRGKVVVENGQFHGQITDGKWIKRKVSDSILSGPAV